MRNIAIAFIAVMLCSTIAVAGGPISFGLQATGASLNIPAPFKDIYAGGFGGGAHLDVSLPVLFAFRLQGDYVTFAPDEAKYKSFLAGAAVPPASITIEGGRINILSAHVNTKLSPLPLPLISPYLTLGAGLTNVSASDVKVTSQGQTFTGAGFKGDTNFSANAGVGVDLNLIALSLYLEARYTWIFTAGETSTYVPVSLGITF